MRGVWDFKDLNDASAEQLLFSTAQGKILRAEVLRRAAQQEGNFSGGRRDSPIDSLELSGSIFSKGAAKVHLRRLDLERYGSVEARVSGAVHLTHPARANCREDFVRPEALTTENRHRSPANLKSAVYRRSQPATARVFPGCNKDEEGGQTSNGYWTILPWLPIIKTLLPRIQPIAPKRITAPFDHTEFVFELKMDGWRCMTYIEDGACRLISRKQNQYKSFGPLAAALAKLKVQNAIIDAEVVCLDAEGKSVFLDLKRPRKANAILYCFDLLWLNNEDLRNLPLVERKLRLRQLVRASRNRSLLYAHHMERHGIRLFQAVCQQDCEGVVGKYKRGIYAASPTSWVKILNPNYSQIRDREEMFKNSKDRRERAAAASAGT